MSHDKVTDMRLDDSEAKSGSGTSPSNGGGSQDSIDTAYELAYKILRPYDVKMAVVDEVKERLTAWHNTQLKAAIPEKIKDNSELVGEPDKYAEGWNGAIDVQQANLEKL